MQWNGASRWEFDGKSKETETTTWSEFPYGGKAIVEQILASEERKKSKRADVRWNRIKNRAQRRRWSIEEKEVKHWVK